MAHPFYKPTQPDATNAFFEAATLRDWFAIQAPEPSAEDVRLVMQMEQQANPHNDSYKPRRRGESEIRCALRYKFADAMLAERVRDDERR